jgi:hypothetical protein
MKKIKRCSIPLLVLITAVTLLLAAAPGAFGGMESDSYVIAADVVSGGGGTMTSDSYRLQSTIGQPSPLMDQDLPPGSDAYELYPGFWYAFDAGPVCVDLAAFAASFGSLDGNVNYNLSCDLKSDGDVDGGDLGEFITGL